MNHDLLHIQGKPYVLVPLHEYRALNNDATPGDADLPQDIVDALYTGKTNPVRLLRHYRGMTQGDLAAAADLSRPYLAEIEGGKKAGSVAALRQIAAALAVPAGLLVA